MLHVHNFFFSGFGVYYSFSKPYTKIKVGDYVIFQWTTPEFVLNVGHGIYETLSLDSKVKVPHGLDSGAPTRSGKYL